MSEAKLGEILRGETERDAVHVALLPVVVGDEYMHPGDKVKFVFGTTGIVTRARNDQTAVGIIDPFLDQFSLVKGTRVWLVLKPGTVTGMRHDWKSEAIDAPHDESDENVVWLRRFADQWNFDYENMIRVATNIKDDQYDNIITAMGYDLHSASELGTDHDEFWRRIEALTGKPVPDEKRSKVLWGCSC